MLNYRKVQIKKKNLPDSINSIQFKKIWTETTFNKESDLAGLLAMLEPFFTQVEYDLTHLTPNYFMLSLMALIDADPTVAISKIKRWCAEIDIRNELIFIVIKRTRRLEKARVPWGAKQLMAEYYFVMDFKFELSKNISRRKYMKEKLDNEIISGEYYDFFYVEEFTNKWYQYLYKLKMMGYTLNDISNITQMSKKAIMKDGDYLCQHLKSKL